MIVNKSIKGLHIILHESHGLLAGKIANEIKEIHRPIHWFETLIAICEHDDRQLDLNEKEYLSDLGVPMDFTEESYRVDEVMERMQRILRTSENKSQWIKLLISYHLEFIYGPFKKKSKRISAFFQQQASERKTMIKHFGLTNAKAKEYYAFLRFCDRLSLILCKDETPELERQLEINTSIGGKTYFIKKSENGHLIITPWIFQKDTFELSVEERILNQTQFSSSKSFKESLKQTMPNLKSWILTKG
ncbi:DUF3891 family protein [Cyclobacterium qasimii]|uniref:DUF3891 family protein n=2 Tax=Cyclobacterium qasimii TaxID=1350429 RepID=S7WYF5_9BACT|nr:DUF3891 family protein [Cyclobacterium qasimii]EPR71809.1 hypothetical protein ADICYQ_0057 [Cyclobacterium qasimii M12-11B]GEO22144.1 hypothetical protein CQA01_26780 [Cyclobacterium qasimii]